MTKVIAVILAGGSGVRFGGATPKQYTKLAGKLVIEHTMDVFERAEIVDEIVIVAKPEFFSLLWELCEKNKWRKLVKVVRAGNDRFSSTRSAVDSMADLDSSTKVLFHDAVRPLLEKSIIEKCVVALDTFFAADVVTASTDTVVSVRDNGSIASIPARASMRRGQTPQAFRLGTIQEAYDKAIKANRSDFTCDCGVVRAMLPSVEVATVEGSSVNIKITSPLDVFLAEKLVQSATLQLDMDEKQLEGVAGKNVVIFGGSSGIGKSIRDLLVINGAKVFSASRSFNGVDVGQLAQVSAFLAETSAVAGSIDHVINTAGILVKKPMSSMTIEEMHEVVQTNYLGALYVAHAAREYLVESGGMLLNFTSSSYTRGRAFYATYSSTKCAVVNLTQALAEEWAGDGVRVNCINPERTRTPMRTSNFGYEPPETLLDPKQVAMTSVMTLLSEHTGIVVDVRNAPVSNI
ncbi:bifunctional cytidylyltransferase/SDR family oxidoreductase [Variovorax sp. J22P271]|uniref:bifunctional cytidylyltransferase/SDR family oxidoreductase n=1 Tax=Variovorax davisae TaxID=3053515 RepID=UPI00257763DD|nr:bifunctional cytidylyltransferase/SDR family oxidoreductase [Variovorax sp. J22P271]MDM0034581.1 bifunctional cytidylyltransferase/SDR family oxidoreductase [Variovorax sp. J22P271]